MKGKVGIQGPIGLEVANNMIPDLKRSPRRHIFCRVEEVYRVSKDRKEKSVFQDIKETSVSQDLKYSRQFELQ